MSLERCKCRPSDWITEYEVVDDWSDIHAIHPKYLGGPQEQPSCSIASVPLLIEDDFRRLRALNDRSAVADVIALFNQDFWNDRPLPEADCFWLGFGLGSECFLSEDDGTITAGG